MRQQNAIYVDHVDHLLVNYRAPQVPLLMRWRDVELPRDVHDVIDLINHQADGQTVRVMDDDRERRVLLYVATAIDVIGQPHQLHDFVTIRNDRLASAFLNVCSLNTL